MARILKREAAKRDLIVQWVWYAENANIEIADRFLIAVDKTLSLVAKQPAIGGGLFVRDTRLNGIRRFPISDGFEQILLFYLPLPDGVDLVRVIHGSRDLSRLFSEDS